MNRSLYKRRTGNRESETDNKVINMDEVFMLLK
jgi:hypothetical protein